MAKKVPQINASSMADISFLLLIFFLVTTSMDVNQGLTRRLPAPIPPDQKIEDTDINKRNLLVVKINSANQLMVQGQEMNVKQLREKAKEFIANVNDYDDVFSDWREFVKEQKEKEISTIITEEKLKEDETKRFIDNAFRDGELKTTGVGIDNLLPPMRRFGGGSNRAEKKQTVIEKLKAFFEKFFGII